MTANSTSNGKPERTQLQTVFAPDAEGHPTYDDIMPGTPTASWEFLEDLKKLCATAIEHRDYPCAGPDAATGKGDGDA